MVGFILLVHSSSSYTNQRMVMSTQLFVKRGRRYYPWGNGDHYDNDYSAMKIGTCRLIYCPEPGHYRSRYDVTPESAGWMAAAMLAEYAMQEAMADRALAQPQPDFAPYTVEQQRLIEQFRQDMAAAGGLTPFYWTHSTPAEIAKAGVDAVKQHANHLKADADLQRDALRYRWIKNQKNLDLRTNVTRGTPWTHTETGKQFYPSHQLAVNGTGFNGIEHLDDLIDQAMDLYPSETTY
jgi:hypothetical protein